MLQSFDPGYNPNQQTAGLMQSTQKAVLYVFSPRRFDAQQRRSLLYRFDERFVSKAQDALHNAGSNGPARHLNSLITSPESMSTVVPDEAGTPVRMDHLSDRWSFLLVINGDEPTHRMRASGFDDVQLNTAMKAQLRNNRSIYYGFFMDEPINPTTIHSHTPTINPHARLMITHKTFVNQMSTWGANGMSAPRFDVLGNSDFVDPSLLSMISPEELHRNTPDKLFETSEITLDHSNGERSILGTLGDMSAINQHQPAFSLNSSLSEPRENLRRVMQGMAEANDAVFTQSRMGPMSSPMLDDLNQFGNHDLFTGVLIDQYSQSDMPGIGLSEGEIVTMDLIESKYHPEVIPFLIGQTTQWDTMDQSVRSAANVWSSLILQAAPVLLTNAGLSEITLQYDSSNDAEQIFTFSHMANASDAEQHSAVRAFIIELKNRLFRMLKLARGEFRIMLSLQSAGVSHCTLNFYDDEIVNTAPVESPSIAGGLITNMLGTTATTAHNGAELVSFVDNVMGTSGDTDYGIVDQFQNNTQMAHVFSEHGAPLISGTPAPSVPTPPTSGQSDFAPKPFVPNPRR